MINKEIEKYDNAYQEAYLNGAERAQQKIEKYKKKVSLYNNCIQMCRREADLIKKLAGDYQDDRVYMAIFVYLLRNGFFSYNKHFEFGVDSEEIICDLRIISYNWEGSLQKYCSSF